VSFKSKGVFASSNLHKLEDINLWLKKEFLVFFLSFLYVICEEHQVESKKY